MLPVRATFLVLLLAAAAAPADAQGGCSEALYGLLKTCSSGPDGRPGVYASTPALFAYVTEGRAGAGSLAGASADWGTPRVVLAAYLSTGLVAFDTVSVSAHPEDARRDGGTDRVTAEVALAHVGMGGDQRHAATLRYEIGNSADKHRATLALPLDAAGAEAGTGPTRARVAVFGYPVVLTP